MLAVATVERREVEALGALEQPLPYLLTESTTKPLTDALSMRLFQMEQQAALRYECAICIEIPLALFRHRIEIRGMVMQIAIDNGQIRRGKR